MLKFPSDQTISLGIINEKQVSTGGEIHSDSNLSNTTSFTITKSFVIVYLDIYELISESVELFRYIKVFKECQVCLPIIQFSYFKMANTFQFWYQSAYFSFNISIFFNPSRPRKTMSAVFQVSITQ